MKEKISKRDWETISAYLDGQLSARKRARLENRLDQDSQLQIAFEQLHQTRQILRSTPRLRIPRNFILTPEMAGQPFRMPRLAPVFGWASAVASFLLVLVLVGDIFNAGSYVQVMNTTQQQEAVLAPQEQFAVEEALEAPSAAKEMDVQLKGSAEDVSSPESQEEEVHLEAAADPVEPAPIEEPVTESEEIELFAAAEEATPEILEGRAGTTAMGDSAPETPAEAPLMAPVDGTEGEGLEPQDPKDELGTIESADSLDETIPISDSVEKEGSEQQPTEMILVEEEAVQPQEAQDDQPSGEAAKSLPEAEAVQLDELSGETVATLPAIEPTPATTWVATAMPTVSLLDEQETGDFVFGTEVILALCALGTGLAWFYMRRRGG